MNEENSYEIQTLIEIKTVGEPHIHTRPTLPNAKFTKLLSSMAELLDKNQMKADMVSYSHEGHTTFFGVLLKENVIFESEHPEASKRDFLAYSVAEKIVKGRDWFNIDYDQHQVYVHLKEICVSSAKHTSPTTGSTVFSTSDLENIYLSGKYICCLPQSEIDAALVKIEGRDAVYNILPAVGKGVQIYHHVSLNEGGTAKIATPNIDDWQNFLSPFSLKIQEFKI